MTVRWTVRAAEPTAVFSPQRKYKTVGSSPSPATKNPVHESGRDFTYYFLPLHSYLKIKFTWDFWKVIGKK